MSKDILINSEQFNNTLKSLLKDISNQTSKPYSNYNSLYDLFKELPIEFFTNLKENIYFTEWLSTIRFEKISKNNSLQAIKNSRLPSIDTCLDDDIRLPVKFLKLFRKLEKISLHSPNFKIKTIRDVIAFDITGLKGIGSINKQILTELRTLYLSEITFIKQSDKNIISRIDLNDMRLFYSNLTKSQVKALEKLKRYDLINDTSNSLLNLDTSSLFNRRGFGRNIVLELRKLKELLEVEAQKIILGEIKRNDWNGIFFAPINLNGLLIEQFGEMLLYDIDQYLDKLSDKELDIFQLYWGFTEKKQVLEDIGQKYNVSRESIRLKAKKVSDNLLNNIRFSQSTIWEILKPNLSLKLIDKIEDFYLCFDNESNFYKFLDFLSNQESIKDIICPDINLNILNHYFAENESPITYEDIYSYLLENDKDSIKNIDNAIHYLQKSQRLRINGDYIYPINLPKLEAVAFTLASHPKGLPWQDITKIVNNRGYTNSKIDTHRIAPNPYIYLSGRGTYKHIKYIELENIDYDIIFDELLKYSNKINASVFKLNQCYQDSKTLKNQTYYVIRYIIKNFGEDYGFYFDGHSTSDSISLEKKFTRITQEEIILNYIKENKSLVTIRQITPLLRSNSLSNASAIVNKMIQEDKIVQIDRMRYTTPENAYKKINKADYINRIESVLNSYNKPIEQSKFEEIINKRYSLSYSRYFYASLARLSAKEKGWYRKYNLYSTSPIPYNNVIDILERYCDPCNTRTVNLDILNQHIAIEKKTASIAYHNWKIKISEIS